MSKAIDLASTAASLGGTAVATKVLTAGWKKVTGNEPPAKNPDPDEAWRDIIVWALLTGLVTTLVKVGVQRAMAKINADNDQDNTSQSEI
ncbi:DUF4235 domain-containing protein [Kocuria carniphila]|uniref:DUF4235 domain-containing protein n=1 Tax=Kocuria carniphila TaxID=262208 RepID=A0ABV3UZR6_9MICC|nr:MULTISPECIES: DUF4235 domain-containing protein [Kocuria]MCT1802218.1 DUF4235 domain-containing protein [Kocuria carniphila]